MSLGGAVLSAIKSRVATRWAVEGQARGGYPDQLWSGSRHMSKMSRARMSIVSRVSAACAHDHRLRHRDPEEAQGVLSRPCVRYRENNAFPQYENNAYILRMAHSNRPGAGFEESAKVDTAVSYLKFAPDRLAMFADGFSGYGQIAGYFLG